MVLVLDNNGLIALASNPLVAAEFPFISKARPVLSQQPRNKCGSCKGARQVVKADFGATRRQIAWLSDSAKQRLRQLSGADAIVLDYQDGGRTKHIRF